MRYKTLFRVLLKVFGVFLLTQGFIGMFDFMSMLPLLLIESGSFDLETLIYLPMYGSSPVEAFLELSLGCYLFFGGKWVTNLAVPDNRIYCPECGYDLPRSNLEKCPECGAGVGDPQTRGTL